MDQIGSIFAKLGIVLDEQQMAAANALFKTNLGRMSAEAKRTSREGAESFRLIDEALGIHVSRVLTRILTQEFPAFAAGLQSLLGVGVVGVLATAGFEFGEHIAKSIERAMKAQEEYKASQEKLGTTLENIADHYALKLAELAGRKTISAIASAGAEEARHQLDELGKQLEETAKKAQAVAGWWNQLKIETGTSVENFFRSDTDRIKDRGSEEFERIRKGLDEAFRADTLNGTHTALQLINEDLASIGTKLQRPFMHLSGAGVEGYVEKLTNPDPNLSGTNLQAYTASLQAQKDFVAHAREIERDREAEEKKQVVKAAEEAAKKEEHRAEAIRHIEEHLSAEMRLADSLAKSTRAAIDQHDAMAKLNEEYRKAVFEAAELRRSVGSGGFEQRLGMGYEAYIKQLLDMNTHLTSALQITRLTESGTWPAFSPLPAIQTATPRVPTLGAGGTTAAQFDAFKEDKAAQLKLAAEAQKNAVPAQERYNLGMRELNFLLHEGLITLPAYTAEQKKLQEEQVKAADHIHTLQEEMQKLLERSTSARAGVQAFFKQLQIDGAENGKATFEMLNTGFKGFESTLVQTITTGRAHWRQYFLELEQMALKLALNKAFASILGNFNFGGLFGGAGGGAAAALAGTGEGHNAAGTDYWPGGMSWVGEQGPELVNLPRGAQVTPNSALKAGGDTHVHNYDFRGADASVIARVQQMIEMSENRGVARGQTLQRETALRKRPG